MNKLIIILTIALTSCDTAKRAQRHYDKAVKLGVRCEPKTDTLRLTRIDSVLVNNEWVKYEVKYDTVIQYNTLYVPKTRYEIKTEYKLQRDSIEVVKYKVKTEYKQNKPFPWRLVIIIAAIFGALVIFGKYVNKLI
jgi:hypothetical protein